MRFVSLGIEEEAHQKGNSFFVFLDPVRRFRSSDYTFTTMKHYDDNNDGSFDDSLQIVATSPSTSDIVLDDKIIGKTWKKMTSIDLSVLVRIATFWSTLTKLNLFIKLTYPTD